MDPVDWFDQEKLYQSVIKLIRIQMKNNVIKRNSQKCMWNFKTSVRINTALTVIWKCCKNGVVGFVISTGKEMNRVHLI